MISWVCEVKVHGVTFYLSRTKEVGMMSIHLTRDQKQALAFASKEDADAFKFLQSDLHIGFQENHVDVVGVKENNQSEPKIEVLSRLTAKSLLQLDQTEILRRRFTDILNFADRTHTCRVCGASWKHSKTPLFPAMEWELVSLVAGTCCQGSAKNLENLVSVFAPKSVQFKKLKVMNDVIFVCPNRDIECGGKPQNWCDQCPLQITQETKNPWESMEPDSGLKFENPTD